MRVPMKPDDVKTSLAHKTTLSAKCLTWLELKPSLRRECLKEGGMKPRLPTSRTNVWIVQSIFL